MNTLERNKSPIVGNALIATSYSASYNWCMRFLAVAIFGMLGVLMRYGIGLLVSRVAQGSFPYATFAINLSGSFLIGMAYVAGVERAVLPHDLRVAMMVGFLGGYTTFSSYSLETFQLISESKLLLGMGYFLLSPCLGLAGTFMGVALARQILS